MILCVTLNPCLDKTLTVPRWSAGDNVRGSAVREVVGGKGNNVARALTRLGRRARPVTFLGGPTGRRCEELLREADGFDPIVVPTRADTRTILTARTEATSAQTAFFDPDPAIAGPEAEELFERVRALLTDGVEALTLSGSSPCPATHGLFLDLVALSRARKVPVYLDTYGPALESIWGIWPDVLQMNRREAGIRLRRSEPGDVEILSMLAHDVRHGVRLGLVTNGPGDLLAQANGQAFRVRPPQVDAVNPIGSGDCLLAGLVDAEVAGRDAETALRRGVASAVANALTWDAGAIDRAEVERIEHEIRMEPIGPLHALPASAHVEVPPYVRVGVHARPTRRPGSR